MKYPLWPFPSHNHHPIASNFDYSDPATQGDCFPWSTFLHHDQIRSKSLDNGPLLRVTINASTYWAVWGCCCLSHQHFLRLICQSNSQKFSPFLSFLCAQVFSYDAAFFCSSSAHGPQCKQCDDLRNRNTANVDFDCMQSVHEWSVELMLHFIQIGEQSIHHYWPNIVCFLAPKVSYGLLNNHLEQYF